MSAIDSNNPPSADSQQPPSALTGRAYWRSLEEYANSAEFREQLGYAGAPIEDDQLTGMSRRRFLQVMAASMSLAGLTLTGCRRWPEEKVAPFTNRPEGRIPGEPVYYATCFEQAGVALGILAESFDGRPIKIEGNPRHPGATEPQQGDASNGKSSHAIGATNVWAQASILNLYDPDRAALITQKSGNDRQTKSWSDFKSFLDQHFGARKDQPDSRVAVLGEPTASPTLQNLRRRFEQAYPGARWFTWAPVNRDNVRAGLEQAFGQSLREQLHLDEAQVIACFDADPLGRHPNSVRHEHDWAKGRRTADEDERRMNRVYAIEPSFSRIGTVADERLPKRASQIPQLVQALAGRLGVPGGSMGNLDKDTQAFIEKLANDLTESQHRGQSLVLVGEDQPAETHALAWAINAQLGNLGSTVTFIPEPMDDGGAYAEQLNELVRAIQSNEIDTLLILGGNPVYDAPADSDFASALNNLDTSIHLGQYANETSVACTWHVPQAHYLEAWGDARAWDGTLSVQQPMILPLYDGKAPIELIAELVDAPQTDGYTLVRNTFQRLMPGAAVSFEKSWRRVLHEGLLADSAIDPVQQPALREGARNAQPAEPQAAQSDYEVVFRPDAKMYDGRWANNAWLQELPGSVTHLTWDNAALISPNDADALGVRSGDMLNLTVNGQSLEMPALKVPGQADGAIVVNLGYGRTATGHVGHEVGFDTYKLRTSDAMHIASVSVERTGNRYELALTTHHDLLDYPGDWGVKDRAGTDDHLGTVVKSGTLEQYNDNENFIHAGGHGDVSLQLYEPPRADYWSPPAWDGAPEAFNKPHAWGMAVDMNACTGCNACVIACQSENNVPVVGKEQVKVNREMHWLRLDRYFVGDAANPEIVHQPMMCVHCENAPCEQVCPVNAAIHDSEGLNLQVYNRCIGTRYCSNNCPYKVRRFNFFDYHSKDPRGAAKPWLGIPDQEQKHRVDDIKKMIFNPDVTVRMRGVMEKCTYCMQRISRAKIAAKNEYHKTQSGEPGYDRDEPTVQDGEVITACQSACPTQAIVFGDLNDPDSEVSKLHRNHRAYKVLDPELNTRPRTQHLAKIRNPKPGNA